MLSAVVETMQMEMELWAPGGQRKNYSPLPAELEVYLSGEEAQGVTLIFGFLTNTWKGSCISAKLKGKGRAFSLPKEGDNSTPTLWALSLSKYVNVLNLICFLYLFRIYLAS